MASGKNSALSDTAKKLSRNIIFNPDQCKKDDLDDILRHDPNPRFTNLLSPPPLDTTVRKIGTSYGFMLRRWFAEEYLHLKPNDKVQLVIKKPIGEKRSTPVPTKKELDSIYSEYAYYFKFQNDVTLSDFNFEDVGNSFYIPVYTKMKVSGTSRALYVALAVLEAFGFKLGDSAAVDIRKVQP